ncbi:hypothetical protein ATM97_05425 [Nocardia sp. MH4]|nr:hypothetical protein [Nocardia sp. MH4]
MSRPSSAKVSHIAAGTHTPPGPSKPRMGMDSVDRQALLDADLDPDEPQVWVVQQRISDLLVCHGISRRHNSTD